MKIMKVKLLILLFSSALVYSSCGGKNTVPTTQSSDTVLSTPVSDYSMMITAKLNIKPEKTKDFIEAAKEMIEKSNNETGCKSYQLYQDPYDNTKFIFVEEYKSQSAIDEHFASDYFKAFGPKIADLIVEPAKIKIISVSKEVNQ
jgi:quinol monooxygenase YgiN